MHLLPETLPLPSHSEHRISGLSSFSQYFPSMTRLSSSGPRTGQAPLLICPVPLHRLQDTCVPLSETRPLPPQDGHSRTALSGLFGGPSKDIVFKLLSRLSVPPCEAKATHVATPRPAEPKSQAEQYQLKSSGEAVPSFGASRRTNRTSRRDLARLFSSRVRVVRCTDILRTRTTMAPMAQ